MHIMGVVVQKLDLVTVCFSGELRLLRLQARSVRMFACEHLVQSIYIVVNDWDTEEFSRQFEELVVPEYGRFADRVKLIDYRSFWRSSRYPDNRGWRTQQILKLMIAELTTEDHYLVLDAKNHFVRPVTAADFFAPDGRMRSNMYRIHPPYIPHFKNACRYFGLAEAPDLTCGLPTTTPFMMLRDVCLSLVREVEHREQKPFPQFFMERQLVEFYLYYAFLLARYGDLDEWYERRPGTVATIYSAMSDDPVRSRDALKKLEHAETYCMGVHRNVLRMAHPEVLDMVHENWQRFGLIGSKAEASYFGAFQEVKPPPLWRRFF